MVLLLLRETPPKQKMTNIKQQPWKTNRCAGKAGTGILLESVERERRRGP